MNRPHRGQDSNYDHAHVDSVWIGRDPSLNVTRLSARQIVFSAVITSSAIEEMGLATGKDDASRYPEKKLNCHGGIASVVRLRHLLMKTHAKAYRTICGTLPSEM